MAGGLFGIAFTFNIKCIIFSIICMSLFLYKPTFSGNSALYLTLFLIFVVSYVGMAWYDYYFDCRTLPLKRGSGPTDYLKPKAPKATQATRKIKNSYRKQMLIYMFHLLVVVPILAYLALNKCDASNGGDKNGKIKNIIYPLLIVLTVFTAGYHGISLIVGSH